MSPKYWSALFSIVMVIVPSYCAPDNPDDYLVPHNKAREEAGVPPLEWDPKLAEYAKETGSKHQEDCALEHSMGPYSENLAGGSGPVMTGTDATNMWVSEKELYDTEAKKCSTNWEDCGHYTNIIDPENQKMGCAKIECPNDGLIFQCDYSG